MSRSLILAVLLLTGSGCKKTSAPAAGLELVYTGPGLTQADAVTLNKRLAALEVKGAALFDEGKLRIRIEPSAAEVVKRSLSTAGKLEFFGVDDNASKRLCAAAQLDGATRQQEELRDGSVTCFFSGEPGAVRAAAEPVLGPKLRLQKLPSGGVRSLAVFVPAFLTGARVVEAKVTSAPSPGVSLAFDSAGAQLLAEHTQKLVDMRLAIVLDDWVQSAPTVMNQITGGHAIVTTPRPEEAKDLAAALASGALPSLQLLSETSY